MAEANSEFKRAMLSSVLLAYLPAEIFSSISAIYFSNCDLSNVGVGFADSSGLEVTSVTEASAWTALSPS